MEKQKYHAAPEAKAKQTATPESASKTAIDAAGLHFSPANYFPTNPFAPFPTLSAAGDWGGFAGAPIDFGGYGTMEAPPSAYYVDSGGRLKVHGGNSFIPPSAAWDSRQQKRKRNLDQVFMHEVIELDEDDDPNAVLDSYENKSGHKNKQPIEDEIFWKKHAKEAFPNDFGGSNHDSVLGTQMDVLNAYEPGTLGPNYSVDPDFGLYDYGEEYYEDIEYHMELMENDLNLKFASKLDCLDLPSGVETSTPWLQNSESGSSSKSKPEMVLRDEIEVKYKSFKQFDTVQDHSDHYFDKIEIVNSFSALIKTSNNWAKRIQHEWRVLEKDLPENIFVRVYEDRIDILRAAIIGPAGTPYHDGIYFFDIFFPPNYPQTPPTVHYHSGGLRINPNLYENGKVCLSLLNTWVGSGCETWDSSKSTMLQVLVSIQALVLNAKPYFNEPGLEGSAHTHRGERLSLAYNEDTFLLSCKTMLYTLRRPPKHFEEFIAGHFRHYGRSILVACKAYLDGAQVGCLVGEGVQDVDQGDKSCSSKFKTSLKMLFDELLMDFAVKGADCDSFLAKKGQRGSTRN